MVVIQFLNQRFDRCTDVCIVHHKTCVWINISLNRDLQNPRMSVKPRTFSWMLRQDVRCFESISLSVFHAHVPLSQNPILALHPNTSNTVTTLERSSSCLVAF